MGDGGWLSAASGALPVQLTRFLGRERESAELLGLIDEERLLSLVGAPGCGKTRLAVEVGGQALPRFAGGVRFVELAPIGVPESASIANAVGAALEVPEEPGRPREDVLVAALAESAPVLVVLDNCEHVVDAAAALAQRLVTECAPVSVLTTSRAALGVPEERVWSVPQLGLAAAVELYVDRARSVSGGASLEEADEAVIEEICARLDCTPLAVELTAAWSRVLSPRQVLDRLTGAAPELPAAGRGRGSRHDTMGAAVDWGYRLLGSDAQGLFRQLSVFAGGSDLEAIQAVAGPTRASDEVLGSLAVLVDNSLVLAERVAGRPMRYRMLEPVRQYADALLATSGDEDAVRRRHYGYYCDLAGRYDPWRPDVGEPVRRERLAQEDGNLLAAFEWARQQPSDLSLRLGLAAASYFAYGGRVNDGLRWLDEALARGTRDSHLQAAALAEAGQLAWRQGDYDRGHARLEEALARAGSLDDPFLYARALIPLSAVEFSAGNIDVAARQSQVAIDTYRSCGDDLHIARALVSLAWTRYANGDGKAGDEDMVAALDANRRFGNATVAAYGHFGLAYGAGLMGDAETMRTHLVKALAAMNDGGIVERSDWLGVSGVLAALEGRFPAALRLRGGAQIFGRHRGGAKTPAQLSVPFVSLFVPAYEKLGSALVDRLVAHGRQMPWDELVAEALAEPGAEPSPLTRREHEIAALVAEGLSNVGIAHELVISRRTVESHVEHIKRKLGLGGRNEIIVWALRSSAPSRDSARNP